jgi:PAS domain S-box-containing protein
MIEPAASSIKILVVDDETTLLELAREFLEQVPGFIVEVERSPVKALEVLSSNEFDAIVSDYQMPVLDGIMFLKKLRARGDDIPFILLTGKGREEVAMEALNNGADYYLQKGVQVRPLFAELANMVRRSVDHKRAIRAIMESESKYRRLFNSNRDAIFVWKRTGKNHPFTDVNEKACSLLGYSRQELLSMDNASVLDHEGMATKQRAKDQFLDQGETIVEVNLISKTGESIPCEVTATSTEMDGIDHIISIVRDRRDKQRFDKETKEREARFRAIFEHSATGIALEDADRHILECNTAFCRIFHRKCDELRGTIAYDLMDPEYVKDDQDDFLRLLNGDLDEYKKETLYRNNDGSPIWANVHFSILHDNGRNLALAVVEDITKRRQSEKLQSSMYQISQATVSAPNLDVLYKKIHDILSELMPAKNFFIGLVADDGKSVAYPYFVDEKDPKPDRVRGCRTASNYVIRTGQALYMDVNIWAKLIREGELAPTGTPPVHWMGAPLIVGGRTIGVMVVQSHTGTVRYDRMDLEVLKFVSDHVALAIDLKRSEEALRESQRMLSTLMGNLPGMAYRCRYEKDWTMDFISDGCRMVTGYAPSEIICNRVMSYNDLIHPDDRDMVADEVKRGVERRDRFHLEYRVITKDGAIRWVFEQGCPVFDELGVLVCLEGFIIDVTTRKKAQEDARLANWKLTLLGDLTRHDVLNRVTLLSGYLGLIGINAHDEKVLLYVEKAVVAAHSIGEQMEFIREYQGLGVGEPEWFDLGQMMALSISKTDLGGISISCKLDGLSVFADPMIEKMFGNLMENSVKHGATVSHIDVSFQKVDDQVEIYFSDDGKGIPLDVKQRLFDRNYMHRLGHGMNFIQEVLRITDLEIDEVGMPGKGAIFRIKAPAGRYRLTEEMGKSHMKGDPIINAERAEKL